MDNAVLGSLVAHVIASSSGPTQPILRLLAIATVMAQQLPHEKRVALSEVVRDAADEIERRPVPQRVEIG